MHPQGASPLFYIRTNRWAATVAVTKKAPPHDAEALCGVWMARSGSEQALDEVFKGALRSGADVLVDYLAILDEQDGGNVPDAELRG